MPRDVKGSKNASRDDVVYEQPRAVYGSWPTRLLHVEKRRAAARCHNQASARRCTAAAGEASRCYIGHTCGWYRSYIHTEELRRTNSQILAKDFVSCRLCPI